jgi:uncharacterized zinc-type alcohol dehydrogenase-like protein
MIRNEEIDQAYERKLKSDVKYRFVIDNATLAHAEETDPHVRIEG